MSCLYSEVIQNGKLLALDFWKSFPKKKTSLCISVMKVGLLWWRIANSGFTIF